MVDTSMIVGSQEKASMKDGSRNFCENFKNKTTKANHVFEDFVPEVFFFRDPSKI